MQQPSSVMQSNPMCFCIFGVDLRICAPLLSNRPLLASVWPLSTEDAKGCRTWLPIQDRYFELSWVAAREPERGQPNLPHSRTRIHA